MEEALLVFGQVILSVSQRMVELEKEDLEEFRLTSVLNGRRRCLVSRSKTERAKPF
jgi:hypothetical protein